MKLNYTLALLTHGTADTFGRAVESFTENVTPAPAAVRVFADGIDTLSYTHVIANASEHFGDRLRCSATHPDRRQGFCAATRRLWDSAVEAGTDFVFWLEADFVFFRPLDLLPLAEALRFEKRLAQMSLIRDAANEQEARAGGLVASRPGEFERQQTDDGHRWLSQQSYFTTTPSLMLSSFMRTHPFLSDGLPHCEGRFGAALRADGFRFGAWGWGEEWVAHMGSRLVNPGHGY